MKYMALLWISSALLLSCAGEGQASAQELPSAPEIPWKPPANIHLRDPAKTSAPRMAQPKQPLSLAELIDLGEERDPFTRAAWERARQSAANEGIAKAALYPTLTGLVLGQTTRSDILFNTEFVRQTVGLIEPALELDYTVFDWNARLDAVRASRYDLFADDFAFNQIHLDIINVVTQRYFTLLNSEGQVAAATISLQNAQTVASEVDARLAQGLATLPDALEARAAAAQALYALTNLKGTQSNAEADLVTVLRLPASTVLPVIPIEQLAPPDALAETAANAIAHALSGRPDLLEREARIAAADQRIRQARTLYLPEIDFTGVWGRERAFGSQDQLASVFAGTGDWNAQLNLRWTLFDGGRRANEVAQAAAGREAAVSELDARRDQVEDQVWNAYTTTQTAFAQQQAAEALLSASEVSYAAAVEAYGDGVRTVVDVLAAQRGLASARSDEITARTNLFQQAATLAYRDGELLSTHAGPRTMPKPTAPDATPKSESGSTPGPQPLIQPDGRQ